MAYPSGELTKGQRVQAMRGGDWVQVVTDEEKVTLRVGTGNYVDVFIDLHPESAFELARELFGAGLWMTAGGEK